MAKVFVTISGPGEKVVKEILVHQKFTRSQLYQIILEIFKRLAPKAARHVIKTQLSGGIAPAFGPNKEPKRRRTGSLARSIHGRGIMFESRPAMEVGLLRVANARTSIYGWTQEFGTKSENPLSPISDIVPKGSRAMTVPTPRNQTGAGVTRQTIDDFGSEELKMLLFGRVGGKHGNVIGSLVLRAEYDAERSAAIAEDRSVDVRTLEPMFLLLTRVQIKPGWYLNDGLRDFLPQISAEIVQGLNDPMIGRRKR